MSIHDKHNIDFAALKEKMETLTYSFSEEEWQMFEKQGKTELIVNPVVYKAKSKINAKWIALPLVFVSVVLIVIFNWNNLIAKQKSDAAIYPKISTSVKETNKTPASPIIENKQNLSTKKDTTKIQLAVDSTTMIAKDQKIEETTLLKDVKISKAKPENTAKLVSTESVTKQAEHTEQKNKKGKNRKAKNTFDASSTLVPSGNEDEVVIPEGDK